VLTITNTSSTNQRATVQLATSVTEDGAAIIRTSTGLSLTRVASGVSSTDTSVTWGTYPTLTQVATAVNALGNGWSATVAGGYENAASSDLRALQGSFTCRNLPQGAINAEVVANENRRADDQPCGETLVVAVPQADDQAEVGVDVRLGELKKSEVAGAVTCQAVGLADDCQPGTLQATLNSIEQPGVRDGHPAPGAGRGGDEGDLLAGRGARACVQHKGGLPHRVSP
jgi:hypothetical protein